MKIITNMKESIQELLDLFTEFEGSDLRKRVNILKEKICAKGYYLRENPLSTDEVEDVVSLYSLYYDILIMYSKILCLKNKAKILSESINDEALISELGWYCHHIGNGLSTLVMDASMVYKKVSEPTDPNYFETIISNLPWIERYLDDTREWSSHPEVLKGVVPQEVWRSHERTVAFYKAFFY